MTRLFGTDGIRGRVGEFPLVPDLVERVGCFAGEAFAKSGRKGAILAVRDTRASGPSLQEALTRGVRRAGLSVADGGVLPTASVAALVSRYGFSGGVVLSASHNPAEFNGIKFFDRDGRKLSEGLEDAIEAAARGGRPLPALPSGGSAPLASARVEADYLNFLKGTVPGLDLTGFPVVLDCGHGAASVVAPALFRSLGARVTTLSSSPDGKNINAGCGSLHPEALARAVVREGARLGAAFDGDADRVILVDEQGVVRDGESALLVAARWLKGQKRLKNNLVVSTVMANLGFKNALDALGIRMMETPVGDRPVAQAMERHGAVLGGEPSGHVIFREFLGTGDGLLTALQVVNVIRRTGRPFSALASLAVKLPQILLNVRVAERKPIPEMAGFSKELRRAETRLNGRGRVLVRYSGTEPLLRIMVEGPEIGEVESLARTLVRAAGKA